MTALDRRNFIRFGTAGIAGLSLSPLALAQSPRRRGETALTESFLVGPGLIGRLEPGTNTLAETAIWTVPAAARHLVPSLLAPARFSMEEIEAWGQDFAAFSESQFAELVRAPSINVDVTDVVGEAVSALSDGARIGLSLAFFQSEDQMSVPYQISTEAGLPVVEGGWPSEWPRSDGGLDRVREAVVIQTPTLYGWKLVFHGPDTHSLGSCVRQPVKHFNFQVHRVVPGRSNKIVANFHLGAYRSGSSRCFVLWNSEKPVVCWKVCSPRSSDLRQMLAWALVAAAAMIAIKVTAAVATAVAAAAAVLIFTPLLLLA